MRIFAGSVFAASDASGAVDAELCVVDALDVSSSLPHAEIASSDSAAAPARSRLRVWLLMCSRFLWLGVEGFERGPLGVGLPWHEPPLEELDDLVEDDRGDPDDDHAQDRHVRAQFLLRCPGEATDARNAVRGLSGND